MRVWLIQLWDEVRRSFWFVPLSMMLLAGLLAVLMAWVDDQVQIDDNGPWVWLKTNASAAKSTLSLLSGAMITLSGVVFSMTMVSLSLTSSQYGSRLLRTLMTDLTTQFALGAFLSTSFYCLVLLRFIPVNDYSDFVPHLAVFLAGILTFGSLFVMIVFVHHVGVSIQAQNVVAEVAADLDHAIQGIYPECLGESSGEGDEENEDKQPALGSLSDGAEQTLPTTSEGYLQSVDTDRLLHLACEKDLVLELLYRPGDFLIRGRPLVKLHAPAGWQADEAEIKELTASVNSTHLTGHSRTPRQDVCCAVNELVEVAVRALSPGINDPFTAVTCIDRMTAALTRLLTRSLPSAYRYGPDSQLRVIAHPVPIPRVIESAFRQIEHYGSADFMVTVRMMEGFEQLMRVARRKSDRQAILEQAQRLKHLADQWLKEPPDVEWLQLMLDRLCEIADEAHSPSARA